MVFISHNVLVQEFNQVRLMDGSSVSCGVDSSH